MLRELDPNIAQWAPAGRQGAREGWRVSYLGPALVWFYGKVGQRTRAVLRWLITRAEVGELYSLTLREVFARFHGVDVGLYSSGAPFVPLAFPAGTRIGRFCSIYPTVKAFNANHPMNLKSTHALFYNPLLGLASEDLIARPPLEIGADVWIGHNAIILPSVRRIGTGAVIGAGSVVHEDVPPYGVVVGHPARVVRYRFSPTKIAELLASEWWTESLADLRRELVSFQSPPIGEVVR